MSISKGILSRLFPDAEEHDLERLSVIWDEVINQIIERMIELSKPYIDDLHINLREEMVLELAKLQIFIGEKVVNERVAGRSLDQISEDQERDLCLNERGIERIENTAHILSENVWIKRYNQRWKPKTIATLQKEKSPKKTRLSVKKVDDAHFIPKSFIRRYWSKNGKVYRYIKTETGSFEASIISYGQWGYLRGLYSDKLEAYFGLVEGDAVRPIEMLLKVEPLNRPQKEALVGFIVIQRLRNPIFMSSLIDHMRPIVKDIVGREQSNDQVYMRSVYETLYEDNEFYDRVVHPVFENRWVVVRSDTPDFVLPDTCNIFGQHEGSQYVIMPITPKDCLIVMPFKDSVARIIPNYVTVRGDVIKDISRVLVFCAEKEFLCDESAQIDRCGEEETNKIIQRIILSIAKISAVD